MKKFLLFIVLVLPFAVMAEVPMLGDSVGIEKVGDKVFVLHRVEAKETLYSISRRYGATVDEIKAANPGAESGISIGAIIKVPYSKKIGTTNSANSTKKHIVKASETLYSISRLYSVTADDIKKWNTLTTNELSIGQELIVSATGAASSTSNTANSNIATSKNENLVHTVDISQTLFSISRMYNTTVDQIKLWNNLTANEISVGQKLIVSGKETGSSISQTNSTKTETKVTDKPKQEPKKEEPKVAVKKEEKVVDNTNPASDGTTSPAEEVSLTSSFKKVTEAGIAELIEGSGDSNKYRALHRTAPIGTIMHIRNDLNDMSVFVRIVGQLPETGVNDKVIIKISKAAFDKLGGVNNRFPVEVTYQP